MIGRTCFTILLLSGLFAFSQPVMAEEAGVTQAKVIDNMAEQAEALIDALLKKHQASAEQHYDALKADLDQLHTLIAKKDFNERRTRELFTAYSWMRLTAIDMHSKAWTGAAIAANQMSGEIIRFTDFSDLTMRDVAWMNYLGMDVMLLSMEDMQGNQQTIDLRRDELRETWKRVREDLIKDFRNKTLVMRGDQIVGNMHEADNSKEVISLARDELAFVDDIEKTLGAAKP